VTGSTVDGSISRPYYKESVRVEGTTVDAPSTYSSHKQSTYVDETTVDAPVYRPSHKASSYVSETTVELPRPARSVFNQDVKFTEETVDVSRYSAPKKSSKMGYYDEDGK